jgi:hypothetical protein
MADARGQHMQRRNSLKGKSAPAGDRAPPSGTVDSDTGSSYRPSREQDDSISFTATSTSRAHCGGQPSPSAELLAAHELLRYQPTDAGRDEWLARVTQLIAI